MDWNFAETLLREEVRNAIEQLTTELYRQTKTVDPILAARDPPPHQHIGKLISTSLANVATNAAIYMQIHQHHCSLWSD